MLLSILILKIAIIRGEKRSLQSGGAGENGRQSCGLINDPLWNETWHINPKAGPPELQAADTSMNVIQAWKLGFTGKGVNVVNIDSGLEHTHDDLFQNYDPTISYDLVDDDDNPWVNSRNDSHGTSMAGLIGAAGNNSKCSIGIAFKANLGHLRVMDGGKMDPESEYKAICFARHKVDIYVFGYGYTELGYHSVPQASKKALREGVRLGRQGRGNIYLQPGGNNGGTQKTCALDEAVNSMYTITINAVGRTGSKPYYGEECAAIMASAFSSGIYPDPFMVTTYVNNSCTSKFSGTSSSVSVAGGIMALVIEANPKLTWRDVQHLIALTSRTVGIRSGHAKWIRNSAGFDFSTAFGFGLLDAEALVTEAQQWVNVGPQTKCSAALNESAGVGQGEEVALSLEIGATCQIRTLEHVYLVINMTAYKRGDIGLRLASPTNTSVDLLVKSAYDISWDGFTDHAFLSLATWGENPEGLWKIFLKHHGLRSPSITLKAARLDVFGISPVDV